METTLIINHSSPLETSTGTRSDLLTLIDACAAAVKRHQRLSQKRQARNVQFEDDGYVLELQSGLREFSATGSWIQKAAIVDRLYAGLSAPHVPLRRSATTLLSQSLCSSTDVVIDFAEEDWLEEATESGHKLLLCALLAHRKAADGFAPELSPRLYLKVVGEHSDIHAGSRAQFLRNGLRTLLKHRALNAEQQEIVERALRAPQWNSAESDARAALNALQDLAMDSSF